MKTSTFLKKLHDPWLPIALKAIKAKEGKQHDPITREEIISALENSNENPPPIVRKLLAQMVAGEYKFKKGIKARPTVEKIAAVRWYLSFKKAFETHPNLDEIRNYCSQRGEPSLRGAALQVAAALYNVTPRTLENWIKEHASNVLEAHLKAGKKFTRLDQVIEYEEELETRAKYRSALEGWPLPPLK